MKFYYTYILHSIEHKRLYVGSTEDFVNRLSEHNLGKVVSTKAFKPWGIVYYEAHRSKALARKAELYYKTGQGRRQIIKKLEL